MRENMIVLKFVKKILMTLCWCIAIFGIYLFIQKYMLGNSFFTLFGYSIFKVQTGSMSGAIEQNDIIVVKIGNEDIEPQDIITYVENNYFITHRVLTVENDIIITKGDANNSEDKPINRGQVLGEVVYVIDMKLLKKVFTDTNVIIPGVITLFLFIELVTYKEKAGEKSERKTDKENRDEENKKNGNEDEGNK